MVYLIHGDVPLLVREACDEIRAHARQEGVAQRIVLTVEPGFDWHQLTELTANRSLFGDRQLIELHNPKGKFDERALKILLPLLKQPNPDHILVIVTPKLTGAQQKTRWVKAAQAAGKIIPIKAVSVYELPRWIQQRLQKAQLKASRDGIQLLAAYTEGNLLATAQAIEKLQLLYPKNSTITLDDMQQVVADFARFNVFDWVNAAVSAQHPRLVRMSAQLQRSGAEPTFVLWALTRELRKLIEFAHRASQGEPLSRILEREWRSRQAMLKSALNRLKLGKLYALLKEAHHVDSMIKGIQPGDAWQQLTRLGLRLAGAQL